MKQSKGKFIITGEHSVVHGELALVSELNKTLCAEITEIKKSSINNRLKTNRSKYELYILDLFAQKFNIDTSNLSFKIKSEIPQKSGLGSSAAFANAIIQELAERFSIKLSEDELFDLVYAAEVFIHKKPSGIDPCAVVYGGIHRFQKKITSGTFSRKKIILPKKYEFLLINSGSASESTGEMVGLVIDFMNKEPKTKDVLKNIGKISRKIIKQLTSGKFDGKLLDKNEAELEKLQVVGKKAQKIIKKIKEIGGHIKISGAGGVKTGSGWLLAFNDDLTKIEELCKQNKWENIRTEIK